MKDKKFYGDSVKNESARAKKLEGGAQGRIQDLSEGERQDFLGTKKFIIRKNKFYLKDSKRVKIND